MCACVHECVCVRACMSVCVCVRVWGMCVHACVGYVRDLSKRK